MKARTLSTSIRFPNPIFCRKSIQRWLIKKYVETVSKNRYESVFKYNSSGKTTEMSHWWRWPVFFTTMCSCFLVSEMQLFISCFKVFHDWKIFLFSNQGWNYSDEIAIRGYLIWYLCVKISALRQYNQGSKVKHAFIRSGSLSEVSIAVIPPKECPLITILSNYSATLSGNPACCIKLGRLISSINALTSFTLWFS